MDKLACHPAALDDLEVNETATASTDQAFFMLREWVTMTVSQKNDNCPEQARSYWCHVYEYQ